MESTDDRSLVESLRDEADTSENGSQEIPASVFEELRQDHQKIGRGQTVTIDVPGYHGNLRVRYKWVERGELTKRGRLLAKKTSDPDTLDILASCDTLITTCEELVVVVDGEEKSLDDPPVTFLNSKMLTKHLGIEATGDPRETIRDIFNNDYALVKTAISLSRWLEDTSREVDLEALGF